MPVGEAFLSAFLQVLFDRLTPKHVPDFIRGHDTENDLKRLKKTLMKVNAVLNDAEDKQFRNEEVKMWVNELKDAAYDAEDVLDEFATEGLRQKLETESETNSNQILSFLPAFLNPSVLLFNVEIGFKMKAITERFDELANQRSELGLKEIAPGSSSIDRETSSVVDESGVYGRDNDKEKIVVLVLKDEPEISVIPIVGMGGVGKTTLAQIVYNDNRVEEHFEVKAWVCVSNEFDVKRITKSILQSVTSEASNSDDLNLVQVKVKKALRGKKFLIVLDDVWSKKYGVWDDLQKPFRVGASGSKIIVTTRNRDVALMMGTVDYHSLEHLSNDDCRSVFVRHAFVNRNIDAKPKLKIISEKIVEKCRGLPLAAKMLGGVLRSKLEDEDEWEDILDSKIWELPEEEGSDILLVLRLSYHHLPSHLKRCFAYCSLFPKDYEFDEVKLVLLWMAEGLVQQPNGKKQMEDVGAGYFRDLLSRSFFQPSSSNKSLFVMHDLVNDLAQYVAGETCFRLEGQKQYKISKKARHSSYVGSRYDGVKKFEAFDGVESTLRTFLPLMTPPWSYLTSHISLDVLPKLRCLRVLSLGGYCIYELPNSIGDLKHLRYLDLSFAGIRSLPESTSSLYNLQTMILRYCSLLRKLPTEMRNLINLRHLDITGASSIEEMEVGKLTSLRELSNFIVGNKSGSRIRELMNLKYLRGTLCISGLENVIDARDVREANFKDKQDLNVLTMKWRSYFNVSRKEGTEKAVLDLLQPHKKLKELSIECYGGTRFPTWIGDPSFSNMVCLRLKNCVKCTSLPPLGQLPLLKDICIVRMNKISLVGLEFYGEGCPKPFPSLETLDFEDMEEWEDWLPSGVEVFPCLRKLSIRRCPKLLGKLPDHLLSLEELTILACQQLIVSISSLPKLCKLNIKECREVVWQRSMVGLNSLKSMELSRISKLMCLTKESMEGLTNVEDLTIADCNELTSLWQNEAGLLTSLRSLKIRNCPKFVSLVEEEVEWRQQQQLGVPWGLESLKLLHCNFLEKLQGLHSFTSLKRLTIGSCSRLESFPETGLPSMLRELKILYCGGLKFLPRAMMHVSLEYLSIEACDSLTSIARCQLSSTLKKLEIERCRNLQSLSLVDEVEGSTSLHNSTASLLERLYISRCPSLESLSSRGELPVTLKVLSVNSCPKLESVAERLHHNTSLKSIYIGQCESLKSLPDGLHTLRKLSISQCEKLKALPHCMHNLTSLSLQELSILSFPEEGFPTNLTSLDILDLTICRPLFEYGLHKLTSLRWLKIGGPCPDLVFFPGEEKEVILPTSLTSLSIQNFPNLEYLSSQEFQNLNSLENLTICDCPKLKFFPEEGLPPLLQLDIKNCPLLKQRCKKNPGRDWPKIDHIPSVHIDNRSIFEDKDEDCLISQVPMFT